MLLRPQHHGVGTLHHFAECSVDRNRFLCVSCNRKGWKSISTGLVPSEELENLVYCIGGQKYWWSIKHASSSVIDSISQSVKNAVSLPLWLRRCMSAACKPQAAARLIRLLFKYMHTHLHPATCAQPQRRPPHTPAPPCASSPAQHRHHQCNSHLLGILQVCPTTSAAVRSHMRCLA